MTCNLNAKAKIPYLYDSHMELNKDSTIFYKNFSELQRIQFQ